MPKLRTRSRAMKSPFANAIDQLNECDRTCGGLARQRELLSTGRFAVEAARGGQGKLAERFAIVIAHDQRAVLNGPPAAGVEVAGASAFRCDRALASAGRPIECHRALARANCCELPAAGHWLRRYAVARAAHRRAGNGLLAGAAG